METGVSQESGRRVMRLTLRELIEIRRALDLITMEDEHAGVNVDTASRKAKASALRKVEQRIRELRSTASAS